MSRTAGKRTFDNLSSMSTAALMKKARTYAKKRTVTRLPMARLRQVEKKGVDTDLTLAPIISTTNTNGSAFVLNLVQAGTGSWNRVGRKIQLQSVRLKGSVISAYAPSATTGDLYDQLVRMVVVWDKQPSGGAIPAYDTVFGRTLQDGSEICQFNDNLRFDNMDRFQVLRDVILDTAVGATPPIGGTTNLVRNLIPFDEFIKLNNREVVFSGQSSPMTIADISTGALYVYFRARYNTTGSIESAVNGESVARLRYTDV